MASDMQAVRELVGWLLWCYKQGYTRADDRAVLANWMSDDPATLTLEDAAERCRLLAMADEILAAVTRMPRTDPRRRGGYSGALPAEVVRAPVNVPSGARTAGHRGTGAVRAAKAERERIRAHLKGVVADHARDGNDSVLGALLDAIRELGTP